MIKLMDKQEIILKHVRDKKSRRCISRETSFAWKTVDKYINEYETKLAELGIDNCLSSVFRYKYYMVFTIQFAMC